MAAVSSRYARALADVVASSKLDPARMVAEAEQMAAMLASSVELRNIWQNPAVPAPQKLKVLDALAAQAGLSKQSRNFLAVLIDQRRTGLLGEIVDQFKAELNDRMGFADAEVRTARELSEPERDNLVKKVAQATGKTVRARFIKDATVLGGAVVTVGSTVYDGSVRGHLERLRQEIAGS